MSSLAKEIAEISALVDEARETAAEGAPITLGNLARRVDYLCTQLVAMPREEATLHVSRLEKLLDELNRLRDAIVVEAPTPETIGGGGGRLS
jgi:hypothetical protein